MDKKDILYGLLGLSVLLCDQFSKKIALAYCKENALEIVPFLSCHVTFNRGVSWSMFSQAHQSVLFLILFFIGTLISFLLHQTIREKKLGYGVVGNVLVLAGAISNCIDRVWYGGVVDFIELYYKNWSWPVFNVADMAIVCGVGLMIMRQIKKV